MLVFFFKNLSVKVKLTIMHRKMENMMYDYFKKFLHYEVLYRRMVFLLRNDPTLIKGKIQY